MLRIGTVVVVLLIGFICLTYSKSEKIDVATLKVNHVENTTSIVKNDSAHAELLFVGDIMLGRNVESLMDQYGDEYPFFQTKDFLEDADLTIGNFEGIVSEEHIKTPPFNFSFSIKPEYLYSLKKVGFDILSLANNHAGDFGNDAFVYTQKLCKTYEISCVGSPLGITSESVSVETVGNVKIGFIFLYSLYGEIDEYALKNKLEQLSQESDIQIAYMHWGEEYTQMHSTSQEKLAHTLIDAGVDTVIGAHPHVVQDIEVYNGKPVFYSLGNFVFDQYFDKNVQQMIALKMIVRDNTVEYTIVPLTSEHAKSQPSIMTDQSTRELMRSKFNNVLTHEDKNSVLSWSFNIVR